MVEDNPLDLEKIKEKQDEDNDLHQSLTKLLEEFVLHTRPYSNVSVGRATG